MRNHVPFVLGRPIVNYFRYLSSTRYKKLNRVEPTIKLNSHNPIGLYLSGGCSSQHTLYMTVTMGVHIQTADRRRI